MPDVTPELLASIATRLYRELQAAPGAPGMGGAPTMPPLGLPAPTSSTRPVAPPSLAMPTTAATTPPAVVPAAAAGGINGSTLASAVSGAGLPTNPSPVNPAAALAPDGLRRFLDSVRAVGQPPAPELRAPVSIRQLFEPHRVADSAASGSPHALDPAARRRDFPIFAQRVHGKPLIWLDNAATTQKPQCVIDALARFYAEDNSNIHRGAHTLAARATDAYEQARDKVRAFLGAGNANEIIFARGTTEAINLVARAYGGRFLQPGDEIVLTTLEHHANIVPWQIVARERGAVIRVAPINDRGEIMLEEYVALLGPRTRIVGLTQASNSLGTVPPVAEMIQLAKRYHARVLIDGAQSVAHLPVNVKQLGCDFFVFSGHKIFGPTGIGALYVPEDVQEIMSPYQGGGNMIRSVTFEETTYAGPPAKFEAGTPNIADAIGLGAALDYVTQVGRENLAAHEQELLHYATDTLLRVDGLRLIGTAREKVGILSFVLADKPPEEVGRLLDAEGIAVRAGHHCAQPSLRRFGLEATVRPSLSLYNTKEEIDILAAALRRIRRV